MHRAASWLLRLLRARRHGADGVVTHDVTTPSADVEAYWTDERLRQARPREVRRPVTPAPRAPGDGPPAG